MDDHPEHRTRAELEAGLDQVLRSPADEGPVELVVARPARGERRVLDRAVIDPQLGLVGDMWPVRPTSSTPDRSPHPGKQLTLMNARVAALVAGPGRWQLAGDQVYVDLDLGRTNLPPGTRLAVGSAVVEVSGEPHTGCAKFAARFGMEAARFVGSPAGRRMGLRGLNTRVVRAGTVGPGDLVRKLAATAVRHGGEAAAP
ncbi:MAG: MOSC domain-containing protein [Acidimicrobiales bacterium]